MEERREIIINKKLIKPLRNSDTIKIPNFMALLVLHFWLIKKGVINKKISRPQTP